MEILLTAIGGILVTYLTDWTKRFGNWAYIILFALVALAAWGYAWLGATDFDWSKYRDILLTAVAWYEIITKRFVPYAGRVIGKK